MHAVVARLSIIVVVPALAACASGTGAMDSSAHVALGRSHPSAYVQIQIGDTSLLAGVDERPHLLWSWDRSSRADRFAGVDDPRQNSFTAAAQALASGDADK